MNQINFTPTIPQSRVWDAWDDSVSTSILTGGGVNSGKTFNLMAMATIKALTYADTRYLVGRKNLTVLMKTTAATLWKVFREFGLVPGVHYNYNGITRTVTFFNKSQIFFDHLTYEPSDPEIARLGGYELTAAFLDEVADCDYRVIEKVHERVGRWNNDKYKIKPIVIMTCNPSRGWLKSKYYDEFKLGKLPEWKRVILSTVFENPHASESYIRNLSNVLSEQEKARQLNGSWEFGDDPDQLTTFESIEAMYYHQRPAAFVGNHYITADIAFSSDRCVVGVWCEWNLIHIEIVDRKQKPEDVIKRLQLKYNVPGTRVAYDSTGAGYYLKNYIPGAYAFHANAKTLKDSKDTRTRTFEHLKTQMYCHLADKVNDGTMKIFVEDFRDELSEEFTMIRSIPREKIDSIVKLITKDEIKKKIGRSPDLLDMASMRGVFDYRREWVQNF